MVRMPKKDGMIQEEKSDDALIEEAIVSLPEIARRYHTSVCQMPEMGGLSVAQIKMMSFLYAVQYVHGGQCTVGDVAHGLGVSMAAASEMVDRLVDEGLVERTTNPADRRQVLVRLTKQARQRGERMHALRYAQLQSAIAQIPSAERPAFVNGLRILAEVLNQDPRELPGIGDSVPAGAGESIQP